jgi:hypothetical protein
MNTVTTPRPLSRRQLAARAAIETAIAEAPFTCSVRYHDSFHSRSAGHAIAWLDCGTEEAVATAVRHFVARGGRIVQAPKVGPGYDGFAVCRSEVAGVAGGWRLTLQAEIPAGGAR